VVDAYTTAVHMRVPLSLLYYMIQ